MKKEIRNFILTTIMKMMVFMVCMHFYGEYIISRDIPGALQLLATLLILTIFAFLGDSVLNSFLKLKNKNS
jgi:hypothetical protein